MRHRRFWLAPLLFVSALAMVPGSGPAAGSELEICLAEPLPPKQIACLAKAAIAAGDPEICLEAEHPSVRWPCVALFADQADDPSLCRILPASEGVPASVSQDLCHVHLAISRRDPTLCDGLTTPNLGDGCYYQLVETGGDRALCERLANPDVKSVCAFDPEKLE
jgi:hypothetical protein